MKSWPLTLLIAIALNTLSAVAVADEPDAMAQFDVDGFPPPSTKIKLIGIGSGVFALSYGAAVGSSYLFENDTGAKQLRIPVVGPWIKLGRTSLCDENDRDCSDALKITGAILAGVDGLLQAGGLALVIEGLFLKTAAPSSRSQYLQQKTGRGLFARFFSYEHKNLKLKALPLVSPKVDVGLGLYGQF